MKKWEYNNKKPILIREEEHAYICQCVNCGKEFRRHKSACIGYIPKYCSDYCRKNDTRVPVIKTCLNCGKEFTVKNYRKSTKCCCQKCGVEYRDKLKIGNKYTDKKGYVHVYVGNGKHKLEHVLVIEEAIGRELTKNECVHHIDHNPSNNDISNLLLMTRGAHSKLHREEEIKKYGHTKSNFVAIANSRKRGPSWNSKKVIRVNDNKVFCSVRQCSLETGVCQRIIKECCEGKRDEYNGNHYAYYTDK